MKRAVATVGLVVLLLAWTGPLTWARTIHVYPSGKKGAEGDAVSGFRNIPWKDLAPGDTLLLHDAERYTQTLYVTVKGTPERPITVKAAPGARPTVEGSIVIAKSEHVVIEGLTAVGAYFPGIIIKEGSHHVTVSRCSSQRNGLGIWIADGAGMDNRLIGNETSSNKTHGIAVDRINCAPGHETVIADNRVYDNGHHGIEVNGNYYVIEGNEVFGNGKGTSGASGIHFYAKDAKQDAGKHNIVRYNIVHENIDKRGPDGNGIQADQWCDDIQIYYNVVFGNEGAGISVYDSNDDRIFNNTLYNNGADPGGSHPYKGELVVASDSSNRIDRIERLAVSNNVIVSNREPVAAVFVDGPTSKKRVVFQNNLLFHLKGGNVYSWGGKAGSDPKDWSRMAPDARDNIIQKPSFASDSPRTPNDFRLRSGSPGIGKGVFLKQARDVFGQPVPGNGPPDLGAVQAAGADRGRTPGPPQRTRPGRPGAR